MRPPQGIEWLVILVIVLLLFGGRKLPDMARGLGRSLRIFKSETREMSNEEEASPSQGAADTAVQASTERAAVEPKNPSVDKAHDSGESVSPPEPRSGS